MGVLKGFFSYVQADNKADNGRIVCLANDVIEQYQMISGEEITLFLDKNIKWGEEWQKIIDDNLVSVAFFIPVITPRYFSSVSCRREMQSFTRKATNLGIKELILPLYYVDIPSFEEESGKDDLVKMVREFQWEDWREIRFKETTSEGYRRAVSKLVKQLVDINRRLEKPGIMVVPPKKSEMPIELVPNESPGVTVIPPEKSEISVEYVPDESPGVLDRLVMFEETVPELSSTITLIKNEILQIGKILVEGTTEIKSSDSQGKGFSGRLIITRQMSQKLDEPVERILKLSNKYSTHLHNIDEGIRIIIEQAFSETKEVPESKSQFNKFFIAVRNLSEAAHAGLGATQKMIDASRPIENMSRDMRPVMRRLRQGLTILVESVNITDDWIKLIESYNKTIEKREIY